MKPDRIASITAAVISIVVIYVSSGYKTPAYDMDYTGPGFFPMAAAVILLLLSLILFVTSFKKSQPATDETDSVMEFFRSIKTPLSSAAILAVYIAIMPYLGFLPSTFIILIVYPLLLSANNLSIIFLYAGIISFSVNYIFTYVLNVDIPQGVLPENSTKIIIVIMLLYIVCLIIYKKSKKRKI